MRSLKEKNDNESVDWVGESENCYIAEITEKNVKIVKENIEKMKENEGY
jgi:hypothetical protein